MQNFIASILFAAFAFLALSAEECGETHYISDSGFDLWCGDSLCEWELVSGSVARASSWHKSDYAVELLGEDVVLTQLSPRGGTSCLRFEMLADIEEDARVTLRMDFFDDGIIDYEQEIGHVRWESLVYLVSTPASWSGVRFTLHKEGPGRARLAQIEATADSACIDKPIELTDKPLGAPCANGAECAAGFCALSAAEAWLGLVCSGCAEDEDCQSGMVCGTGSGGPAFLLPARACIPEASRAIGTLCSSDGECATGVCCDNRCSECCSGADCEGDCVPAASPELSPEQAPLLCASGGSDALCVADGDCESQSCSGGNELRICETDGRDCTADADCPQTDDGLATHCLSIGIEAGRCQ